MIPFALFFQGRALEQTLSAVRRAFDEDGPDLTSNAVFAPGDVLRAVIVAKEDTLVAGLPLLPLILEEGARREPGEWALIRQAEEGSLLARGAEAAALEGGARLLLRAERVLLNFLGHMSGIANLTRRYAQALRGTGIVLLDTRKTLPGLRFAEKYAVLAGGGRNHRLDLAQMLLLKDNHIDAAGGIAPAVARLRAAYSPAPPLEVECRTLKDVDEALACRVERIMLDNMDAGSMEAALARIPPQVEVEVSGGVSLDSLGLLASLRGPRKPDFVSVGRITHSAPQADFSLRLERPRP
ncbi:MAG: carboxylating nicotinate-nucleotide diphosphorylase [Desulfovibrio sp.]|jgi:nicotinate-nucleotide pyrophosphorylase (carboxylating)|nr:carboxylating nicotinate-nucleotide diphosphorylase [Desulfovibrio sp.]